MLSMCNIIVQAKFSARQIVNINYENLEWKVFLVAQLWRMQIFVIMCTNFLDNGSKKIKFGIYSAGRIFLAATIKSSIFKVLHFFSGHHLMAFCIRTTNITIAPFGTAISCIHGTYLVTIVEKKERLLPFFVTINSLVL